MFDNDDRQEFPVGMAYVPIQTFRHIYNEKKAMHRGTIFEKLDLPFLGKDWEGCNDV